MHMRSFSAHNGWQWRAAHYKNLRPQSNNVNSYVRVVSRKHTYEQRILASIYIVKNADMELQGMWICMTTDMVCNERELEHFSYFHILNTFFQSFRSLYLFCSFICLLQLHLPFFLDKQFSHSSNVRKKYFFPQMHAHRRIQQRTNRTIAHATLDNVQTYSTQTHSHWAKKRNKFPN